MLTGRVAGPRLAASTNSFNVTGPATRVGASEVAPSGSRLASTYRYPDTAYAMGPIKRGGQSSAGPCHWFTG
eukprot:11157309-Lingulodinium_polyedra.AAC.1